MENVILKMEQSINLLNLTCDLIHDFTFVKIYKCNWLLSSNGKPLGQFIEVSFFNKQDFTDVFVAYFMPFYFSRIESELSVPHSMKFYRKKYADHVYDLNQVFKTLL